MMAWIQAHQELGRHPKLLKLAGELRIHRAQALGHLLSLWWWALDYRPEGDLSALTSAEISAASDWPGDADRFLAGLQTTGFLDQDGRIHDWYEYAGKLVVARKKDAERKRVERALSGSPPGPPGELRPLDIHRMSDVEKSRVEKTKQTHTPRALPAAPWGDNNSEKKVVKLTDVQRVVLCFKAVMNIPMDNKDWDSVYFKRYTRPAKDLLALFGGDMAKVGDCIDQVVGALERKRLSWTPETIVKHASSWMTGALMR